MRVLGLDIGQASVGVGIVDFKDDDIEIIHASTRLFTSSNKKNNADRRTKRCSRRLKRRAVYRVNNKMKKLLDKYNIVFTNDFSDLSNNPYELRVKGLTERLNDYELVCVLSNYLKHRGVDYIDEIPDDEKGFIVKVDSNKYICQDIVYRLKEYERKLRYRQPIFDSCEIGALNGQYVYLRSDYVKEIRELMNTQIKYNDNIDNCFAEEFLAIFLEKRKYYEGPGDKENRSNYGIYREDKDDDGNYITWDNLFENLIGKCSVYVDERRAPRLSYTAQEFNFLNDLNNLLLDGRKITFEEKKEIFQLILDGKIVNLKTIAKVCNVGEDKISGYRKDSKGKLEIERFQRLVRVMKKVPNVAFKKEEFDLIADTLSLEGPKSVKAGILKDILGTVSDEDIETIYKTIDSMPSSDKGHHSLSYKAMNEIMPDLWNTSKNQQQLFMEKKMVVDRLSKYKGLKSIPIEEVIADVCNPVVKRSYIQTCKIIERALKKYGPFDKIIIEMARDLVDDPLKIEKEQRANRLKNESAKEEILKYIRENNLDKTEKDINAKGITMYRLWLEQNKECMYALREISIDTLMANILKTGGEALEIDHIFPVSISFDDSVNNKALVYRKVNQEKKNMTPYQYLNSRGLFESFEERVVANKNFSNKKKQYFLMKENLYKIDVLNGFISRNLVDTRYSSKLILNMLQDYFKANSVDTKVATIKGGFTAIARKSLGIKKDRVYYKNHAEDALAVIFAVQCEGVLGNEMATKRIFDCSLDEVDCDEWKLKDMQQKTQFNRDIKMFQPDNLDKIKKALTSVEFKYSHKVDKKNNRVVVNQETIKGTRQYNGDTYVISKMGDIYSDEQSAKLASILRSDKESEWETLLVYNNDFKTFEKLREIATEMYGDSKNPFAEYREQFGYIRKYSKKGNGVIIKSLRYRDKRIGSCLDISHKYGHNKDSKKVVQLGIPYYRTDIYFDGDTYCALNVPNKMFKYRKGEYVLDIEQYEAKKLLLGIDNDFEFKFSLYKGDLVGVKNKNMNGEVYTYTSASESAGNKINLEFKHIDYSLEQYAKANNVTKKRIIVGFNKSVLEIKKYSTDILGNRFEIKSEKLKTNFN